MSKTCEVCGGFIATLCTCDEDDVFVENKRYREALERIACLNDTSMWPGGLAMRRIATEALSTDQPLTDDERKMLEEYCDKMYSISPKS